MKHKKTVSYNKLGNKPYHRKYLKMEDRPKQKKVSIVIPVFNNELNLTHTVDQIIGLSEVFKSKGYNFECIFVEDGSEDKSYENLINLFDKNKNLNIFKIIKLTKNFWPILCNRSRYSSG